MASYVHAVPHPNGGSRGSDGEDGVVGVTEQALVVPNHSFFLNRAALECVGDGKSDAVSAGLSVDISAAKEEAVDSVWGLTSGGVEESGIVGGVGSGERGEERVEIGVVSGVGCESGLV